MAAVPPPPTRRRPRPGSLERPVNGRLYRGTWLIVGLPLLVAAFSVARPQPLPAPAVPPAFDAADAVATTTEFVRDYPNRVPGTAGALQAASWVQSQLQPYGLHTRVEPFTARVPGVGVLHLQNLVAVVPGHSTQAILVMAHRDNDGTGPGANNNASGTIALVQLARAYSALRPAHTIMFLSTDGGAFGALGAAEFAAHAPERHDIAAVINLDTIAGHGRPRLEIGGDTPRTTTGVLLETAAARIAKQAGRGPSRPSVLRQLIDLGFPYNLYDQAPFISREIAAVTLTTGGDRPRSTGDDTAAGLDPVRFGQLGRAAADLLGTLDQGLEFVQGTSSYVYVGSRLIRGWAVELVLIAMLLPFMAAAIDLFARCRRRHISLAPALRSYRSRFAFWAWIVILFELFDLLGLWPNGVGRPPAPSTAGAGNWPVFGLVTLGLLTIGGWLVARDRLIPRRAVRNEEELAGHTAALLCLAALSLLVVATNPYSLLFLLPSLHAWLWLPLVRRSSAWVRAAILVAGFLGPGLVLWSFASRYGLGWDTPWYLLQLRAVGYVPLSVLVFLVPWLAAAGQLAALTSGRYAPYPATSERPPLGPARRLVRRAILSSRARRRASELSRRALEG